MEYRAVARVWPLTGLAALIIVLAACQPPSSQPPPSQPAGPPSAGVPDRPARPAPPPPPLASRPPPKSLSNLAELAKSTPAGAGAVTTPGRPAAPITLTGSDGTGLELTGVEARAVIEGPLAFTELRLRFHNPENRRREGRFAITLPDGAAVSRFAMSISGKWMEGEVVEKQRARRIYEDFLHRRQDPAILEQDAGNTFRARVFPIEAKQDKELIVSWSQELIDPSAPYTLPLLGLPLVKDLRVRAFVQSEAPGSPSGGTMGATIGTLQVIKLDKQDFQPSANFEVYPAFLKSSYDGLRQGGIAIARVTAPAKNEVGHGFDHAVVLFDTSASEAVGFEDRVRQLTDFVGFLGKRGAREVAVIAFDQTAATIFSGAPGAYGVTHEKAILERGALGASDLGKALGVAGKAFDGQARTRLIVFTNGVPTAGPRTLDDLRPVVGTLAAAGIERLDTVTTTTARDADLLAGLVVSELKQDGITLQMKASDREFGRLARATLKPVTVSVPGAGWVWPDRIVGLQPGQSVLVYADLPASKPFKVALSGGADTTVTPRTKAAARPLLERAWIAARIRLLTSRSAKGDPDMRQAMKQQAIKLSLKHRVLSQWTALLVLETEADYRRYGIERKALADILTVSPDGVAVNAKRAEAFTTLRQPRPVTRSREKTPKSPPAKGEAAAGKEAPAERMAEEEDDAKLDMADSGAAPPPAAMPSPEAVVVAKPAPMPKAARAMKESAKKKPAVGKTKAPVVLTTALGDLRLVGSCDQRAARRILTRAKATLDACYRTHGGGRRGVVTLQWTIGAEGKPAAVRLAPGSQAAPALRQCLVKAISTLRFAAPAGGTCQARVPIRLGPGAAAPGPPGATAPGNNRQGTKELEGIRARMEAAPALTGQMADLERELREGKVDAALKRARKWRAEKPTDVLALVALGRALSAAGKPADAARAYGSLLDLYPSRADLRRYAGNLLDSLGPIGHELAVDTYRVAMEQRPDHPSVYHALAVDLMRTGKHLAALDVLARGLKERRRRGNFPGVDRILREDMALVAAALLAKDPTKRRDLEARLREHGVTPSAERSVRFVLSWETDANDVDFHIFDRQNNHASYSRRQLSSGGQLYADVTRGYGPECFTVLKPSAFPYTLYANYYRRGPMGWGMGRVQIMEHDGDGKIEIRERPFVIMNDGAWAQLGRIKG